MAEIIVLIGTLVIVLIASFTLILSLLISRIPLVRIRQVLPLTVGIVFYFVIGIFPHVIPGFPGFFTSLQPFSPLLLLPFFILAPLPFIEKKTGIIFNWLHILAGAAVTTVYYYIIVLNGRFSITGKWQTSFPEWTISSVVVSALLFLGISYLHRSFSPLTDGNQEKKDTVVKNSFPAIRAKKIIIIAAWLFVLVLPFFLLGHFLQPSSCGGFTLYRIDESNPPEGKIIHLTDRVFSAYPGLGSVLRNPHVYDANRTLTIGGTETRVSDLGSVQIYCSERREKYDSLTNVYSPVKYLEYDGKLYYATRAWIH